MKFVHFFCVAAAFVTTSCSSLKLPWSKTAAAAQQPYDPYAQQQYAAYPQQQQQAYAYPQQQQQPAYAQQQPYTYQQQTPQQPYAYPNYGATGEQAQVYPAGGNYAGAQDFGGAASGGSGGNAASGGRAYVVQKRDTLSAISRKYNVSVNSLMRANNLNSDLIKVGDRLTIP